MKLNKEQIKDKTNELYESLPSDIEERKRRIDIRDQVIELNYSFFGFVAKSVILEGVVYEDKLQSALLGFLEDWWKYRCAPKYRTDLTFTVFFTPRLSERVRRSLCKVSYTQRRGICNKAAKLLNKKWTDITYDDISKLTICDDFSASDMVAIKSIFGADYPMDLTDIENVIESPTGHKSVTYYQTNQYDSLEEMLIQEMIEQERLLTDKDLKKLAEMLTLDYFQLKQTLPKALDILYKRLKANE